MNFIRKAKAKRLANYVIKTIKKYYNNIDDYDYYINLIKSKDSSATLSIRFDSKREMTDGFWKYYERWLDPLGRGTHDYFPSKKIIDCIKQYKQRPTVKFYKIIQKTLNRYDKNTRSKDRQLYNKVYEYIHNGSFEIKFNDESTINVSEITITNAIKGCKVIVK